MIPQPLLLVTSFAEDLWWRLSLEARSNPTVPYLLQSDLGEAAMWTGSLHSTSNHGGPPRVNSEALSLSGSLQADHGTPRGLSPSYVGEISQRHASGYKTHPSWNLTQGPCPEVTLFIHLFLKFYKRLLEPKLMTDACEQDLKYSKLEMILDYYLLNAVQNYLSE